MYESGALPVHGYHITWFKNGELIDGLPDQIKEGEYLWSEGIEYQL